MARIPVYVFLLFLLFVAAAAQEGFTSIDCGVENETLSSTNNIRWVGDDGFVSAGSIATLSNNSLAASLRTLRYFSDATSNSNCYSLPVYVSRRYLVRALYYYGNYDKISHMPHFNSSVDGNFWAQVSADDLQGHESIWTSGEDSILSICFKSTDATNVPFISALETRLLPLGSYSSIKKAPFFRLLGGNFGAVSSLRYPEDPYDRTWMALTSSSMINTTKNVTIDGFKDQPPQVVLMTASEGPRNLSMPLNYTITLDSPTSNVYAHLYFWDFRERTAKATCIFEISISVDGKVLNDSGSTIMSLQSEPLHYSILLEDMASSFNLGIKLSPLLNSTLPPVINAVEVYAIGQPAASLPSTSAARYQRFHVNALALYMLLILTFISFSLDVLLT